MATSASYPLYPMAFSNPVLAPSEVYDRERIRDGCVSYASGRYTECSCSHCEEESLASGEFARCDDCGSVTIRSELIDHFTHALCTLCE